MTHHRLIRSLVAEVRSLREQLAAQDEHARSDSYLEYEAEEARLRQEARTRRLRDELDAARNRAQDYEQAAHDLKRAMESRDRWSIERAKRRLDGIY